AYLDDYAFFVDGLLALHAATHDEKWLNAARRLTDQQIEHYWDETGNAFFFTAHDHEKLIARTKNAYDAVLPSGNSIAVRNLVKLAERTKDTKYLDRAKLTLDVFAQNLKGSPMSMTHMALAMGEYLDAAAKVKPGTKTSSLPTNGSPIHNAVAEANDTSIQLASNEEEGAGANNDLSPAPKPPKPVTAKAYLSTKQLPAGGKCRVAVVLTIQKGWHTYANPAGSEFFRPTVLTIESKLGTKLGEVSYPKGKYVEDKDADDTYYSYEGSVTLIGEISTPASAAGQIEELQLKIRHQACDAVRCLRPATLVLNGKLRVAAVGDVVEPTNQSLFRKPQTPAAVNE
ncbi:MAG: protein-disulfide reductase DsbD family protein, partial [Planctomycetota bacterium]|nr:protein-disulfide reductase DsbD family protein [Planctomycetota bacterium]